MAIVETIQKLIMTVFNAVYYLLWGDLLTIPLPGGSSLGLSLLILILIPSGLYFTLRTRFLPFRLFPEMLRITLEKKNVSQKDALSGMQALFVSTATRVGMGNLVGVVAAISAGGAGVRQRFIPRKTQQAQFKSRFHQRCGLVQAGQGI